MRLAILPVYIVLLALMFRKREGRLIIAAGVIWFGISYLPFFAVAGYADRFSYVASAGVAVILAASLVDVSRISKRIGGTIAVLFLVYLGIGMENRITTWKEAGAIARSIPLEIKQELPTYPLDREVILLNIPTMHKNAYVFLTSLDRAISRVYPGEQNIHVQTSPTYPIDANSIVLEYTGGKIVRRSAR
jgi:hypothetical protein